MNKILKTTAIATAMGLMATAAYAESITVTSFGGAYANSQREAYWKPYTADTGIKVIEDEYNGELSKLKAQVESGNITWDVVDMESGPVTQGCDEGVLEVIDWKRIHNADDFIKGSKFECGVGTITWSTIIAYNKKAFPGEKPKTMADFFDLKKFPGKRGYNKKPTVMLEFALIGDGVPASKVFEVLSTPAGVDRAFAKLDTIKDSLVWWESGAQAPQLLADGEVVMTAAWNGRIQAAIDKEKQPFVIIWDGQVIDFDGWAIPKGSKNIDAAYKYINYVSSPERMGQQHKYISYGPVTKAAAALITDPAEAAKLPSAPQNLKNWVPHNTAFWANHFDELNERFLAWIAK